MTGRRGARPHGPKKLCGSRRKKGRPPCERPAGWGTAHPGLGRCKLHGGIKPRGDKRIRHGLYSPILQLALAHREQEWDEAGAASADLQQEISTLRALAEFVAQKGRNRKQLNVDGFLKVVDRVIRAVDAQQRAEKRGMISLQTVQRYVEALGLVIAKHVKDPDALSRIENDARAIPLLAG